MFYSGIDIAKNKHKASVINQDGKELSKSISFANSKEGCEKLLLSFKQFKIDKKDVLIGMEATGYYWLTVYEFLSANGFNINVIN